MAKITYIAFDGTTFNVDAENGSTVMENAIRNAVPGIEAECGGACACGGCHVYVDPEWMYRIPAPSEEEIERLDEVHRVEPNSRLCCQIMMTPELDGLTLTLAPGSEPD